VCCALVVAAGVAEAGNVGIVRPQGDRFVVKGAPFYFVGTNAYYMITMSALGAPAYADDQLAVAQALGFTVMRVMGFANGPGTGMGGAALQPAPGVFNEASFRAFDYVLHKADLAGVRLLIALVNGNPAYGGVPQYLQWCGGSSERAFYEASACKALYKNYLTHVLNRVNTYNGRPYKDDPTIFAWELANEPHIQQYADPSGQVVRAWVAEMAAHIKAHDPNHMVATGEEGYDNTTAGYAPVSAYNNQAWLFDGNKGLAWTQNTADPNIDFGSIHLYPELWNLAAPHGHAWIADHVRIARSLGKPLVLGEFGASQNTAATFDGWLQTLHAENGAGALAWQVMCGVCYGMRDQFGIPYPPASAATNVLAQHAAIANAGGGGLAFTVGATTASPAVLGPSQAVTVQTSVTAALAATGIIVDVEVHDAAGVEVAQGTFSGQSFAAGQTRSYTWTWSGSSTPGAYRVVVAVFDATRSTRYAIADPAASVTVQPPPSPSFTLGATTATPSPVTPGQTLTVATIVIAGAAASGIVVDVGIWNGAGTRVAQHSVTGQTFAAGQSRTYTWPWTVPAGLAAGTYRVSIGVWDATWQTDYVWTEAAATFAVQAPAPLAFTVGATSASPSPVTPGQTLTVASTITASAPASGIVVDVGLWNAAGTRVVQHVASGQTFAAGQSRGYSWPWTVPAGLAAGTYRVSVGVFSANWATNYVWVDQAATVAVQAPAVLSFSTGPTTVSPNPVSRGQSVTVGTAVQATAAASGILVDLEIYDPQGRKVGQQVFSGQSFAAGQTRSYTWTWPVPANRPKGTYTVKIGIFNGDWSTLYLWVNGAGSFQVQ
jgi:mannan endo-1,4-beta-mannosidase